jgi:hypothetical protein
MFALLVVAYVADLVSYTAAFTAHAAAYVVQALPHVALDDTVSWGIFAGVFTPILTSIAQRKTWSGPKRTFVGLGISVVIAVLTCLADGTFDHTKTLLATVAAVTLVSVTTYHGLWKPSGVAPKIESATTPGARHAA